MGYSYKRLRFIPAKKPDATLYEEKKSCLQKYDLLAQHGKINHYYFDESGFSVNSNIPYAWSPVNATMVIKSFHAKRFNVLGFISKQEDLKAYIKESSVNSENIPKWANRGLILMYLPPYSPELNIIEILWRFIKYHWLEMSAYQSYSTMKEYVQRMFNEYGDKRVIDFTHYLW